MTLCQNIREAAELWITMGIEKSAYRAKLYQLPDIMGSELSYITRVWGATFCLTPTNFAERSYVVSFKRRLFSVTPAIHGKMSNHGHKLQVWSGHQ